MRHLLMIAALLGLIGLGATARAAPPPLAAYGRLPAMEMVRLSPLGDKIAFVGVNGEARQLFIRSIDGEALLASPIGTGKVQDIHWAGDDYVLIEASATVKFGVGREHLWGEHKKAELSITLIANAKDRTIKKMFDHQAEVIFGEAIYTDWGPLNLNGRWYEFVGAYTAPDTPGGIYKVDLETGKYAIIPAEHARDYGYLLGEQGGIGGLTWYDEIHKTWNLFAGDSGDHPVLTRPSPLGTASVAGGGRTPGTVVVNDNDGETESWEEVALTPGATPTPLFQGKTVESLLYDPSGRLLIGALLDGGQTAQFFDPKVQHRFDAARRAFKDYQITLASYSNDLAKMVIRTDGADDSGTYWLIDMTTGKAESLMAAYPDVQAKDVGPTRLFAYKAADGLALDGVLTLPPGSDGRNLPLVLMPHGGPFGEHDRVGFDWWAQAFASRGYAVFQPNYRGSGGHGVAFIEKGYGQWGRGMLSDMADGVAALAQAGIIDPRRACIVGGSYGGYAALAGVTIQHGLYRCAVSVSGVSDVGAVMSEGGVNNEYVGGRINQRQFGARTPFDRAITDISPVRHARAADAPILMIHGKDDTVVPLAHSTAMRDALRGAGKPVELLVTIGEDHHLSRQATRVQTLEASVAFVETHNPADPSVK